MTSLTLGMGYNGLRKQGWPSLRLEIGLNYFFFRRYNIFDGTVITDLASIIAGPEALNQ